MPNLAAGARRLEALVQLAVLYATMTSEPSAPDDGDVYILPAGKSGTAWSAMANGALAYWLAWEELSPREVWLAHVDDVNSVLAYNGGF